MSRSGRSDLDGLGRRMRAALETEPVEVPVEEMWDAIVAARAVEVPVEEMWEAIVAERAGHPAGSLLPERSGSSLRSSGGGRRRRAVLALAPLAAAAVVLLALGIGRAPGPGTPGEGSTGPRPPASSADLPGAYSAVAADHFREAETLLALFRVEGGEVSAETERWARSLLGTTRLLMDSPAHDDPLFGEALDDLELVLVQIATVDGGSPAADRRWVEESLEHRQLMTKLRTMGLEAEGPNTIMEDD